MRFFSWVTFVVVAVLAGWHHEARACDRVLGPNITGFTVLPADGTAGVPQNATPFVVGADLELALLDSTGAEIPTTLEDIVVLGEYGVEGFLRRAIPATALATGPVTVRVDGINVSTFSVDDVVDDVAPVINAGLDEAGAGSNDSTGFECGSQSFARIGVASEDAAFFVGVKDGEPELGAAVRWDGASSSDQLFVFGEGGATVNVAGVDLAGNVSAATPVDVEFPALTCASTSSRDGVALAAIALVALQRPGRRRRGGLHGRRWRGGLHGRPA